MSTNENNTVGNKSWNFLSTDVFNAIYWPIQLPFTFLRSIFSQPLWVLTSLLTSTFFVCGLLSRYFLRKSAVASRGKLPGDSRNQASSKTVTIGFFHPYCNAGGGGERVLWCAIRALQARYDFVKCVVYTGDTTESPEAIADRAKKRFNIQLKRHVHFVYLNRRAWVTAERYPLLTLLGQSLGSVILGIEALYKFTPDIYLDTMGYAFTLPLFKFLGGCKVGCYVHYPTISTDMLEKVNQREADFNNAQYISQSFLLSNLKNYYYKLFAFCYGFCGRCSDVVMVNSSWTHGHINALWKIPNQTSIVFPPCDTKALEEISIDEMESQKVKPKQIISVAQFRPEKNHLMQLNIFKDFQKQLKKEEKEKYKLLLVGSCRDKGDEARVQMLKDKAKQLHINKYVSFHLNVSYEELIDHLSDSIVGLHTMRDEHFGIGVVEFMAAGLVTLAHNSAGPKMDIVIDWNDVKTGYLADSTESYVKSLKEIFSKKPKERYEVCAQARQCVKKRFSEETFKKRFLAATEILLI
ncbi:GDP-Man:Man(3)GlcNAc(2)-PP-Dol alpha-1,2-mannosyltransferase-like [Hydractinia symbiolongicarpus]|uniref:GDP-Man:Man(3)GlcNAc(2)-PP-Dol alpha-1,2-mannosyltransferase-like n=1 Tax=Hydractinia symbiolongicarpus TaxID=13093 RepID=UPI00254FFA1B|nr:GDP-Man:Man(3)GlcNAc(2)-PP-Dol alpha-1,2-mannosyltransferase-like [Hydractinia symbiolongicarpus]XP_057292296.1 GDP-Man:Man(3)GlcNAc(2)-PP-Dol alpha-1,2-mannosyltransferase-like [Hydractinia symbiolongicarpus]